MKEKLSLLLTLIIVLLFTTNCTIVKSGEVGVRHKFGKIQPEELKPGIHFWFPVVAGVSKVDIKTQTLEMGGNYAVTALSKDGLNISVDCTLLYHVEPDKAAEILTKFGPNITGKIIVPIIRSTLRDIISEYESSVVYKERDVIKNKSFQTISNELKKRYIIAEEFLIRDIELPEKVAQAIENKRKAYEEKEQMKFVLEKEKLEAERKRVEAQGIADANRIIANSLTDKYLSWYFFKNIKAYAEGDNNTVVLLPYDKNVMPLINIPSNSSHTSTK